MKKKEMQALWSIIRFKAKDLAEEMTMVNVQAKDLHGKNTITKEHVDNITAIRQMLIHRGIVPRTYGLPRT